MRLETAGGQLIGIEIRAAAVATASHTRHLAWLRDEVGDAFAAGIVLYTGPHVFPLAETIVAAPVLLHLDGVKAGRVSAGSVPGVMIRDARPEEYAEVGELRVAAYRALGLLPEDSPYADTLRRFGFPANSGNCAVLVAASGAANEAATKAPHGLLGTIALEPFDPASELARDATEADIRAFAVAPRAQGQGVGRQLLLAVIERARQRGVARLRLCTRPAMRAAQHLYEATGFTRTPELDFEPLPGIILRAYELDLPREHGHTVP